MKDFCICVLTHDEPRSVAALKYTINNLYNYTNFEGSIDIRMLLNGYSDELLNTAQTVIESTSKDKNPDKYFDTLLVVNDINTGCSCGVNAVNDLAKEYKFVLFLEGDWILLPGYENWLKDCLTEMRNTEVEMIYLRKFTSPYNMRQYGSDWAYDDISLAGDMKFRTITKSKYTNNPVIRRNSSFYNNNIYPLKEVENENKQNPDWGKAEIDTEVLCNKLYAEYYGFGCFVHFNEHDYNNFVTELYEPRYISNFGLTCPQGLATCKFGFISSDDMLYCRCCRTNIIESYESHHTRYMKLYHNDTYQGKYLIETQEEIDLANQYKNSQI